MTAAMQSALSALILGKDTVNLKTPLGNVTVVQLSSQTYGGDVVIELGDNETESFLVTQAIDVGNFFWCCLFVSWL